MTKTHDDWLSRVQVTHLEKIPEASKRGPRYSPCQEILKTAMESPTGILQLTWTGDSRADDLLKSYRSLMQFRSRVAHKYPDFKVRKDGNKVFITVGPQSAQVRK